MKKIQVEGFLDDLFDMFKDPEIPAGSGVKVMEDALDPHSIEDLYEGVLLRLRQASRNKTVKDHIMPEFFPDKGKESTLPKTIDPKLIAKYGDKLEDVIVEYCTVDAMDIIKRTQERYKNAGKSIDEITGDQYFGTILQQVHKGDYDIIDQLISVYKEFTKAAKKKEWQVAPEEKETNKKSKSKTLSTGSINALVKSVKSKTKGDWTSEDIVDFMSSEAGMSIVADAIARTLNKSKSR